MLPTGRLDQFLRSLSRGSHRHPTDSHNGSSDCGTRSPRREGVITCRPRSSLVCQIKEMRTSPLPARSLCPLAQKLEVQRHTVQGMVNIGGHRRQPMDKSGSRVILLTMPPIVIPYLRVMEMLVGWHIKLLFSLMRRSQGLRREGFRLHPEARSIRTPIPGL